MTGMELCLIIFLLVVLYIAGVVLFIYGVNEESGGAGMFGVAFIIIAFMISHMFTFSRGTVNVTSNSFPNSLREGVIYTNVKSNVKSVEEVRENNQHYFLVWISWNEGNNNAIYKLKENPPNRFYINQKGDFYSVDNN